MRNKSSLRKYPYKESSERVFLTIDDSLKRSQYKTIDTLNLNNNSNSFSKTKINNSKREKPDSLKLNLNPNITKSKFRITKTKFFSPPHSIFNRFQKEFRKTFTKSIYETKQNFSLTIFKNKPEFFISALDRKRIKKYQLEKLKKKNPFGIEKEEKDEKDLNNNNNEENEETEYDDFSEETENSIPTVTFTRPSNIYNYRKNYKRKRDFKIYKDENYIIKSKWKDKIGIKSEYKFNSYLEKDLKFQSDVIKDELSIILDNIQYYKSTCLSSPNIISSFKNKEINYQSHINKMLEELNFLLNKVPKIILKEYYDYNERFIAIEGASYKDFKTIYVYDESEIFITNAKLLNRIASFLKCCFDVYIDLISQIEDDMIIKRKDFDLLLLIFERIRFLIGELTISGKNTIKDLIFDRKLIDKYKYLIYKKNDLEKKNFEHIDISEKMIQDLHFKKNETTQKLQRISNSFNSHRKENDEILKGRKALMMIKNKNKPISLFHTKIMTQMLKYFNKDVRGKIISLRAFERYQKNAENNY